MRLRTHIPISRTSPCGIPGRTQEEPKKNPRRTQEEPKKNPPEPKNPASSVRGHSGLLLRKPSLHPGRRRVPREASTEPRGHSGLALRRSEHPATLRATFTETDAQPRTQACPPRVRRSFTHLAVQAPQPRPTPSPLHLSGYTKPKGRV